MKLNVARFLSTSCAIILSQFEISGKIVERMFRYLVQWRKMKNPRNISINYFNQCGPFPKLCISEVNTFVNNMNIIIASVSSMAAEKLLVVKTLLQSPKLWKYHF